MLKKVVAGTILAFMGSLAFAQGSAPATGSTTPPPERVKAAAKGTLKNPYSDSDATVVEEGRKIYFKSGCNGCHGGGGGGGMCPPLTNDTWVYGGDDDTLFRLVALGSQDLQAAGYARKGHENVVGPMPPHGVIVKTEDDLWKIITFIRSNFHGSPARKFGDPPPAATP
ncbi:Cytochrome C oxidase, cbb3-type, subunit III [Solimonas aquatica]|uniref:Cytochrome C oxidase, cbb3-type, subunit III n=1 Tax=Solimonas aquatica TaxID=489703 RepID=A0A1H9JTN7_9GAMM|nr:c-type cytochrome [Solimonas aquatica]SEQ90114.1 Cytochrome C oxidase, cbb3-type, subunit III [Solimonas aquatica]